MGSLTYGEEIEADSEKLDMWLFNIGWPGTYKEDNRNKNFGSSLFEALHLVLKVNATIKELLKLLKDS